MGSLKHFNFIAAYYDRFIKFKDETLIRQMAELPSVGWLLDVGGGTGRVTDSLRKSVDKVEILDISFQMLNVAISKDLQAVCGDARDIPHKKELFERVLLIDALHHCPDQEKVIRDMWRVLKPGGLMLILEPDIKSISGKLIILLEKILQMGSKFYSDESLFDLLNRLPNSRVKLNHSSGNSIFVIKKS